MKKLIVVCGPTAIGKTAIAMELANYFKIPVISADSRQIYQTLDIGTAKPSRVELALVKHFFIDHLRVDEEYSVGKYEKEASDLIYKLFLTSDFVLVVGGTGLYLHALIHGLDVFPDITAEAKSIVENEFINGGLISLNCLLKQFDPEYYSKVDHNNPSRLRRALEVYYSTGRPFSSFISKNNKVKNYDIKEIYLALDRKLLYQRINLRVEKMIDAGLIQECQELIKYKHCQALQTVGYKEIFDYLEDKCSLSEAVLKIKQHTRNYAKRQITWFSKHSGGLQTRPDKMEEIIKFINS